MYTVVQPSLHSCFRTVLPTLQVSLFWSIVNHSPDPGKHWSAFCPSHFSKMTLAWTSSAKIILLVHLPLAFSSWRKIVCPFSPVSFIQRISPAFSIWLHFCRISTCDSVRGIQIRTNQWQNHGRTQGQHRCQNVLQILGYIPQKMLISSEWEVWKFLSYENGCINKSCFKTTIPPIPKKKENQRPFSLNSAQGWQNVSLPTPTWS